MEGLELDRASVEALLKGYETALNSCDTQAVMELYGKSPIFLPQNSQPLVGREAIRRAYDQTFGNRRLNERFTIHEVEVMGDVAWARASSSVRIHVLASGTEAEASTNQLYILHREGGTWKLHRYIFGASRAPATT